MVEHPFSAQIGSRVTLAGHFDVPVVLDDVRRLGAKGSAGFECRVRLPDGTIEEAVISPDEAAAILGAETAAEREAPRPADPNRLRLLVESSRIRLACTYDRQFAVRLSGIRTLPHEIEGVYLEMLPQPQLRFLLADDFGAGGPAPLTIQWRDEMLRFFNEPFRMVHSANDQQQLLNLRERERQIVASIDYAKQDDVRERVWQQRWDLVIIEAPGTCLSTRRPQPPSWTSSALSLPSLAIWWPGWGASRSRAAERAVGSGSPQMSGTRRSSSTTPAGSTWCGEPLENPDAVPVMVRNPARHLDPAKKEVVAARNYYVPASAVEQAAQDQREGVA